MTQDQILGHTVLELADSWQYKPRDLSTMEFHKRTADTERADEG